jgi:hypothetical protein
MLDLTNPADEPDAYERADDETRLLWEELDSEREAHDAEVQALCDDEDADQAV